MHDGREGRENVDVRDRGEEGEGEGEDQTLMHSHSQGNQ